MKVVTNTSMRKLVRDAVVEAHPRAQVAWEGSGHVLKLYVKLGTTERWLTIDTAYADTADRVGDLIDEVLDMLA